jgi:hypothetical protein
MSGCRYISGVGQSKGMFARLRQQLDLDRGLRDLAPESGRMRVFDHDPQLAGQTSLEIRRGGGPGGFCRFCQQLLVGAFFFHPSIRGGSTTRSGLQTAGPFPLGARCAAERS